MILAILAGVLNMFQKPKPEKVNFFGDEVEPFELFDRMFGGNGEPPFQYTKGNAKNFSIEEAMKAFEDFKSPSKR